MSVPDHLPMAERFSANVVVPSPHSAFLIISRVVSVLTTSGYRKVHYDQSAWNASVGAGTRVRENEFDVVTSKHLA